MTHFNRGINISLTSIRNNMQTTAGQWKKNPSKLITCINTELSQAVQKQWSYQSKISLNSLQMCNSRQHYGTVCLLTLLTLPHCLQKPPQNISISSNPSDCPADQSRCQVPLNLRTLRRYINQFLTLTLRSSERAFYK